MTEITAGPLSSTAVAPRESSINSPLTEFTPAEIVHIGRESWPAVVGVLLIELDQKSTLAVHRVLISKTLILTRMSPNASCDRSTGSEQTLVTHRCCTCLLSP